MGFSLADLAARLGGRVHGDGSVAIEGVATLSGAGPGTLTFLANRRYRPALATTRAGAVVLAEEFVDSCPTAALVVENPYATYARAAALLHPMPPHRGGRHPRAVVADDALVAESAWVGACAVIESGARVDGGAYIGSGCVVGEGASVGEHSRLAAAVTLCAGVRVGRRALIHPGVVIGADGFGIAMDEGRWVKVPQLGAVTIGDDVEIGANTTIDCGAVDDTVIGDGVKLDNLVQIGHNVRIGAHTAIAGCTAIAGSAVIGSGCTIAGAVSIAGHIELVDDVHLTATSSVAHSIREPGVYSSGMPVQDNRSWRRNVARMRQLDDIARRLKRIENELP